MWTATGALRDNSQAKGKDIRRVFESIDLPSFLNMKYPKDYEDRYKRVWTFIDSMIKYNETIEQILSVLALVSSNDEWDEKFDRVPIITCHAAKGLEWKVVFLPGISEGLFPYYRAEDDDAIDEERRLFYVACTRAKDNLYILHSEYRRAFGQGKTYEPSRFLNEVGLEQRKPKYLNVKEKIEYGIQSPNNEAVSGLAYWF
jgi:superfamily I DNA/RNA helicase